MDFCSLAALSRDLRRWGHRSYIVTPFCKPLEGRAIGRDRDGASLEWHSFAESGAL